MKIFIAHKSGLSEMVISEILPRIGDRIDILGILPHPMVKSVLLWPSANRLENLDPDIKAIVAVD